MAVVLAGDKAPKGVQKYVNRSAPPLWSSKRPSAIGGSLWSDQHGSSQLHALVEGFISQQPMESRVKQLPTTLHWKNDTTALLQVKLPAQHTVEVKSTIISTVALPVPLHVEVKPVISSLLVQHPTEVDKAAFTARFQSCHDLSHQCQDLSQQCHDAFQQYQALVWQCLTTTVPCLDPVQFAIALARPCPAN